MRWCYPITVKRYIKMTKWHFYIKTLKQVSDFHLGRHFFGLVGGFFVGLSVILWLEMTKDSRKMKEI